MELLEQTEQLITHLENMQTIYRANNPPESKNDKAFFQKVKTYTAPIYDLLSEWEDQALHMVKARQLNLHPQQITSTKENMETLMLHSLYVDIKRKPYMEMVHSTRFILDKMLDDLRKQ
ncbi:hypothetical protein GCM10008983_22350 [Lentibacillus halophilus]|uniref:DUF1798 family protein n=1 Tax=Lentibacillus halophilus TaxID=295065 RepID=A0ABP3J7E0_9BACI